MSESPHWCEHMVVENLCLKWWCLAYSAYCVFSLERDNEGCACGFLFLSFHRGKGRGRGTEQSSTFLEGPGVSNLLSGSMQLWLFWEPWMTSPKYLELRSFSSWGYWDSLDSRVSWFKHTFWWQTNVASSPSSATSQFCNLRWII